MIADHKSLWEDVERKSNLGMRSSVMLVFGVYDIAAYVVMVHSTRPQVPFALRVVRSL